jgi:hypothetical protein
MGRRTNKNPSGEKLTKEETQALIKTSAEKQICKWNKNNEGKKQVTKPHPTLRNTFIITYE